MAPPAAWPFSRRRRLLLGGLGAGIAGILPAETAEAPRRPQHVDKIGSKGGAIVPPLVVSLADLGGVPGAAPEALVRSFERAFGILADAGGGTLLVPPGLYDFGTRSDASPIILCRGARDIAISAYGASFHATTAGKLMPSLFYFFNFSNLTLAGASFFDKGFTPWVDWQGMYCVGLQADAASSGFNMVDCYAERVLGLLSSNNNVTTRSYLKGIKVRGEVRDSYYGVGANYVCGGVDVDLSCHNVRRAFIAYGLKDADIAVRVSCTPDWPGSNGLIALVSEGASMGNVEKVRVRVDVTGACIHASYVHFYHQGPEKRGSMHDIDATVNLMHVEGARTMFTFDHETEGVIARTQRSWDRIRLHGKVAGAFDGRVIANPTVSSVPGTIYLDAKLAALARGEKLAASFRVRPS